MKKIDWRSGDMSAFRDVLMNNNRHTLGYVQDHNIVAALLSATTCRPGDAEKQVQISGKTNPLYTT
jgi:hypothetical protein